MTHDEAYAELDAIAFDLLDTRGRAEVLSHVEQCATCRQELDARRALIADLAFAAPLATDSASREQIRDRLTARVRAEKASTGELPSLPSPARGTPARGTPARGTPTQGTPMGGAAPFMPPRPTPSRVPVAQPTPTTPLLVPTGASSPADSERRFGPTTWIAIVAGVVLLVSGGLLAVTIHERDDVRATAASEALQGESARRRVDSLLAVVAARDSVIAGLASRDVLMMMLTSSTAKDTYARMSWDRARGRLTLIARNMPELKPGRTYQLWLLTSRAKITAGTFTPRGGEAVVMAEIPLTEPLSGVAITDEPEGGVPQPTGPVVIAANAR